MAKNTSTVPPRKEMSQATGQEIPENSSDDDAPLMKSRSRGETKGASALPTPENSYEAVEIDPNFYRSHLPTASPGSGLSHYEARATRRALQESIKTFSGSARTKTPKEKTVQDLPKETHGEKLKSRPNIRLTGLPDSKVKKAKKELATMAAALSDLAVKLDRSEEINAIRNTEIQRLLSAADEQASEMSDLQNAIQPAYTGRHEAEKKVSDLERELKKVTISNAAKLHAQQKALNDVLEDNGKLKEENENLRLQVAENLQLKEENENLRLRIAESLQLEKDNRSLKQELEDAKKSRSLSLREQIEVMKQNSDVWPAAGSNARRVMTDYIKMAVGYREKLHRHIAGLRNMDDVIRLQTKLAQTIRDAENTQPVPPNGSMAAGIEGSLENIAEGPQN
ncbi:hypothetical protein VTL71DRAFT_9739 [Oculimacula yallundae]|uniref:Uncharacterized protein n=1 Tax=Oculimacula yallundae TaxID=86028 RepID=A0ABR4BRQ7_9HELO